MSSWRESQDKCIDIGKLNFVRSDGAIKLPPGFRFQPTDQEIVFQYLIRKVFSCPLPASIIPDILNISKHNPWDLPGDWEQDIYFFNKDEPKYGNGNIRGNKTSDGYWKATGFEKQITRCTSRKEEIITGMKKTFAYYQAKPSTRTQWIMHEYRLVHSPSNSTQKRWIQMGNWVLCHIFLNKRSRKTKDETIEEMVDDNGKIIAMADDYEDEINSDYDDTFSSSSCSFSDSSVITHEVTSSRSLDHEERSSSHGHQM